jgi:acyl transferase domain-containing protein
MSLDSSIAIIGLAGRFPGAPSVDHFWRNLRNGVESIARFSDDELRAAGVDPGIYARPDYVRARGILDGVDLFDAGFFAYSPRDAEMLDPQQRVFLECAWEALEQAAYDPFRYDGAIGVYAGMSPNTYLANNLLRSRRLGSASGFELVTGNGTDFLTTRVSYKLNLRGPSVDIQTACSTSLVAVAAACQSLLSYQCDIALAGGVSITVPQRTGYVHQPGMILSPDGHCRAFDARARGTVAGEGAGVVVLKRLSDAVADRDHILAVILGSAINNDGALKVGFTAPSVEGQAEVITLAQAVAGVKPDTIEYVETHGTGTELGDPIEVAGLIRAFGAPAGGPGACGLGSVKTNIGHADAAAGVASLIKAVMALVHREMPPSLHFEPPNPALELDRSPFFVNASLRPWPPGPSPRRAGVSSFGIGGTNAHVVLEESPAPEVGSSSRPWQLLTMSARSPEALDRTTQTLREHLEGHPELDLADVAYTLHVGRRP